MLKSDGGRFFVKNLDHPWAMVPAGIRLTILILLRGGWMDDIHRTFNISENVLTLNFFYFLG